MSSLVVTDSTWGNDGKGQDEREAKGGLQCKKQFAVVNSQLPIWVYWLPGEIVLEKQICPQMLYGWLILLKQRLAQGTFKSMFKERC